MKIVEARSGLMECPECGHRQFANTKRKGRINQPTNALECPNCQQITN